VSKLKPVKRNFKGVWIPRVVYLDDRLTWTEKILVVEVDSLDGDNGCFASNEYLGVFLGVNKTTVSTSISKLKKLGFIYEDGKMGRFRKLKSNLKFLVENERLGVEKEEPTISENQKHNNIDNNTDNSIYAECIKLYDEFCHNRIGCGCKMDGLQGKAMKSIIKYLKTQVRHEKEAKLAWEYILRNWDRLDEFHQKQIKLNQIDSNLMNILNQLRNGKKRTSDLEQKIRDRVRQREQ
jgi:DNA-binding transcriptional regulator YhcF (GntR family)